MKMLYSRYFNQPNFRIFRSAVLCLAIGLSAQSAAGQSDALEIVQTAGQRNSLLEKAERAEYNVLFVEFCCLQKIQGRKLFLKIGKYISEGDIFSRQKLDRSLKALNKVSGIYDVSLDDVVISVDDEKRIVNILYKIREK